MRKPNPLILKLMYQAGAYPFDDFDVDGNVVGMWVIPTAGVIPIVICVGGNGHTVSALQAEIKRLGNVLSFHHNVRKSGIENWTYEIHAECGSGMSRVYDRKMVERSAEEIVVMTNSFLFVPWFDPPAAFRSAYSGKFDASLIPDPSVTIPNSGLTEVQDWDAMPGPNVPVAEFIPKNMPGVERPRLNLAQFRPFAEASTDAADLLDALSRSAERNSAEEDGDTEEPEETDEDTDQFSDDADMVLEDATEDVEEEEEVEPPAAVEPPRRKRGRPRKNP